MPENIKDWTDDDLMKLAKSIRKHTKPMILAANKADIAPNEIIEKLKGTEYKAVPTSAEYELALRKASEKDLIDYIPGDSSFKIISDEMNDQQINALDKIRDFMEKNEGLGVQQTLEKAIYDLLDMIVVYPVENEHNYTDKNDRVLPDAQLLPRGSTAEDLAYAVHTDIGEGFIRAVDARTDRVIGREHELNDGDVIKIVSK